MNTAHLDERRHNAKLAEMVQRAIILEAESGYVRATRYLINRGLSKEVIERVLLHPAARRAVDSKPKEPKFQLGGSRGPRYPGS